VRAVSHRRWTQSDITDLRAKVLNGTPLLDLATALQREIGDVSAMTARLRLSVPAQHP